MNPELILASNSPRRRELVGLMQLPFMCVDAEVDERLDAEHSKDPAQVVQTLARRKAAAAAAKYPGRWVLGADTVVYAQGQVLGKPEDAADARRMVALLQDAWHEVHTGICLITPSGEEHLGHACSRVHFVHLTGQQMDAYVATGEPFGKAGAYAIQGTAGMYIDRIEGSFSNVIGLPTQAVHAMLAAAGFPLTL